MNCIDVSQWQGVIDWDAVKPHIGGAILRAGYGAGHPDKQFARNAAACNRLGIPCGAYWFSYARTPAEARAEAEHLLAAVKPYRMELPLCFDFEYDSVSNAEKQGAAVTKTLASEMVRAFCGRIEEEGYWALNYANPDFLSRYYDADVQKRYGLWLAQWTGKAPETDPTSSVVADAAPPSPQGEGSGGAHLRLPLEGKLSAEQTDEVSARSAALPVPPRPCAVWQYSSSGSVPGIEGRVDMDFAYTDFPAVMRARGLNRLGDGDAPDRIADPLASPAGGGGGSEASDGEGESGGEDETTPVGAGVPDGPQVGNPGNGGTSGGRPLQGGGDAPAGDHAPSPQAPAGYAGDDGAVIYEFTRLVSRGDADGAALALARRLGLPPDEAVTGLALARALLKFKENIQ